MGEDDAGRDEDLTLFLKRLAGGDEDRAQVLMPYVYEELRAIALGYMRHQAAERTLQPTVLVHDAFVKLFDRDELSITDRMHFFRLAAKAMRQLLVDHARSRKAEKRGGGRGGITLDEAMAVASGLDVDWVDLDALLSELATRDPRQAQIVELRFYSGLEVAEVADVLGISKSTVEMDWRAARAWLGMRLRGSDGTS